MISDLLDELRTAVPDCRLAAYIDLESVLVLAASSADKPLQEALDALAETADRIMPLAGSTLANCFHDRPELDQAIFHTPENMIVFARSMAEVVCCVCAPGSNVDAALSGAQQALKSIGNAE